MNGIVALEGKVRLSAKALMVWNDGLETSE
jgi:hypothetical protein